MKEEYEAVFAFLGMLLWLSEDLRNGSLSEYSLTAEESIREILSSVYSDGTVHVTELDSSKLFDCKTINLLLKRLQKYHLGGVREEELCDLRREAVRIGIV